MEFTNGGIVVLAMAIAHFKMSSISTEVLA